jgi:hypothetical protein
MKFKYTAKWIDGYGISYTPRVPIIFTNPKNKAEMPIMSLIDSGSSDTILDPQVGEILGIDITSGEKIVYGGSGGNFIGYLHPLILRVAGGRHSYDIECAFASLGGDVMALLGQRGFFEHHKVTFERYINEFEVILKK